MSNKPSDNRAENLWPTFSIQSLPKPPVTFLKEQAQWLGQSTRNLVVGQVTPCDKVEKGRMATIFLIVASSMNYRIRLFTMFADLGSLYPVRIQSSFLAQGDTQGDDSKQQPTVKGWTAVDEAGLLKALTDIFNNPRTRKAVESMMAQSAAFPESDEPQ